ncbi:MAG: mechanosensitive ion channel family protein [Spirochaetales bacterium]|nr:mechanosensitive ion channel family protein [Spirochaetales bacterium]
MKVGKIIIFLALFAIFIFPQALLSQENTVVKDLPTSAPLVRVLSAQAIDWLPDQVQRVLEIKVFDYPIWRLALTLLVIVAGISLGKIINSYMKKYAKRLAEKQALIDNSKINFLASTILSMRRPFKILLWSGLVRLVSYIIIQRHATVVVWASDALLSLSIVVFIYDFVEVLEKYLIRYVKKTETPLDDMLVPILRNGLRVVVVAVAIIQMYQNLSGQDLTSILAGLGIAGMAVALAAQDTIKNFFGFLMIALDQPFTVGERVVLSGYDGVIEEIGLRSVRLNTLEGHMVTIPNSSAANDPVMNISRRPNIRRIMNIGITYDTSPEKIQEAIDIIKNILDNHEGMREPLTPRVYFDDMKADSLNIFAIYWYHPPDYWAYMDHAQSVNMEIYKRFNEAGICFAFPTQTVHLEANPDQLEMITRLENSVKKQIPQD